MDWIDKAIRDLCELPDRSSPEDDPEAIVATADEIRRAIEANFPAGETQQKALAGLVQVARAAWHAADDSEERCGDDGREHVVQSNDFDDLSNALDALEELPDDQPGYVMYGPAKAEWALRDLMTPNAG